MILDSSAVVAILGNEASADRLVSALEHADVRRMSAAALLETSIVMFSRYGEPGDLEVDVFVGRLGVEIVPVTAEQAELARSAYRTYGRGHHRAGLNFGDCFSYALARSLGEPLLFTGGDFARTDAAAVDY